MLFMCMSCVCVSEYMPYVYGSLLRPEEDLRIPGAGVKVYCWPPSLGTENYTQVSWKSCKFTHNLLRKVKRNS